jgi:hypothetical protein
MSANPLLKFLCFLDIINMSFCLDESKSIRINVLAFSSFISLSTSKFFVLSKVNHLLHWCVASRVLLCWSIEQCLGSFLLNINIKWSSPYQSRLHELILIKGLGIPLFKSANQLLFQCINSLWDVEQLALCLLKILKVFSVHLFLFLYLLD